MLDLGPIEARCAAASPGEWIVGPNNTRVESWMDAPGEPPLARDSDVPFCIANCYSGAAAPRPKIGAKNAEFIAHARQDLPACVAEIKRLRIHLKLEEQRVADHRAKLDVIGQFDGNEDLWGELVKQRDEAQATVRSLATMLGWQNVPPRESLERNLSANRQRLENAEAENEQLRAEVARLERENAALRKGTP